MCQASILAVLAWGVTLKEHAEDMTNMPLCMIVVEKSLANGLVIDWSFLYICEYC